VSGRVLIGDAERDRYLAALREHFAAGRLGKEELERRSEIVLRAAYADEAAAALAELPGVVAGIMPPIGERRVGWLRRKGHAETVRPAAHWVATAERFRDPSTGAIMRVWVDPADGSRHYVPDES
jgi:hypothetical protein